MPRSKTSNWIEAKLGAPLYTIEVPSPHPEIAGRETDLLEDCRYIGSYDWSSYATKKNPAIVVPGSPNVWSDPSLPLQVSPDRGVHIRDNNNHLLPNHPLLPLLVAVDHQGIFAREDWKTVDFVTNRNGLRKLLRWVTQASGRDFRINTQLVGHKTVVLNRQEQSTTEKMSGHTFGFNFEKATTSPMPPSTTRSSWHHRIVTYNFGRFKMVVQFEVDGCVPHSPTPTLKTEEDALVDAMENLGVSAFSQTSSSVATGLTLTDPGEKEETFMAFGLTVHQGGRADIPHTSIVEMATRCSGGTVHWKDKYPQLYLSQTGNHFLARHQHGEFHQIEKLTLSSPELQVVHKKLEPAFKKLEAALGEIQSIVTRHGKKERLSLVYKKPNLTVHKNLSGFSCFPQDALKLFD